MARLEYDSTGRLLYTREMDREGYTLLMPQMLPVHFRFVRRLLEMEGHRVEVLETTGRDIVDTGLQFVHNDMCYPAVLVIGQLLSAVRSGRYDPDKTALLITQTGGGCRASNYIHMLRKAVKKAGYPQIPIVSINMSGMEPNPGFPLTLRFGRRFIFTVLYGDLLLDLGNQCRPYETEPGTTDRLIEDWTDRLLALFSKGRGMSRPQMRRVVPQIVADFARIPRKGPPKRRVGVVGEIYVKYAPLGNNDLANFLLSEGVEPVIPGAADFLMMKMDNRVTDIDLYGGSPLKHVAVRFARNYFSSCKDILIAAVRKEGSFRPASPFSDLPEVVKGYVGLGNKMGEGWLLTAEILELIRTGTPNIVCAQPFGCLPNHIIGKGMMRKIKTDYPESNIVAVDYDPGATRTNQENRIKLMLANAK